MRALKGNPLKRTVGRFLQFQEDHPVFFLVAALVLAALSIFYTARNLTMQTGQRDLVSPRDRLIQLARQTGRLTQTDAFVVVIESADPSRALEFLHALVPRIEADKENFRNVFYRIDPEQFKPWALFYLDEKDLRAVTENLLENSDFLRGISRQPTLVHFFERLNREMADRMVGELFTGFLDDKPASGRAGPFDLDFLIRVLQGVQQYLEGTEQFASPWTALRGAKAAEGDSAEGYFRTPGDRYLIFFVTPVRRAEFTGTWHSIVSLRRAIAELGNRFPDVRAGVTGPEALNADQMKTAVGDMEKATLISLGCLAVLFCLFRRSIRIPLLETAMILIALAWCFGLTTLIIGHLNILSITFAPLLLGLGVDYGAHWFARMQEEERCNPAPKRDIIRATMLKIGPAMLLTGMSLSLAFFPLMLTGFKGLVELGIICTVGMVVMAVASLLLLPPLVQLFLKLKPQACPAIPAGAPGKPFFKMTRRRALLILCLGAAALVPASWSAARVHFDLNMLNLQAPGVESVVWEKKLLESSALASTYGEVIVPDLQEARRKSKQLEALPTVTRTQSLESLLPRNQENKAALLRKIKPLVEDLGTLEPPSGPVDAAALTRVLGRIKFKMQPESAAEWGAARPLAEQMRTVGRLIDQIRSALNSPSGSRAEAALGRFEKAFYRDLDSKTAVLKANVRSKPMRVEDLPKELRERFISADNRYIIRVYPRENIWQPAALGRFVDDIRSVSSDALGDPVTLFVFTQAFRDSCIKAALYGVIFIFVFVGAIFRDIKSGLLVLIPLLTGTAWTFGMMPPAGIDLNLANTIFLPLIVGAGVEYGMVIVSRRRQERNSAVVLPRATAMGVMLAGLSTTFGFGSLMISSHQGIFSLGLLAALGSLAVLIASVVFLPAVLYFLEKDK